MVRSVRRAIRMSDKFGRQTKTCITRMSSCMKQGILAGAPPALEVDVSAFVVKRSRSAAGSGCPFGAETSYWQRMWIPITPHYDLVIFDCDGVLIDSERIA